MWVANLPGLSALPSLLISMAWWAARRKPVGAAVNAGVEVHAYGRIEYERGCWWHTRLLTCQGLRGKPRRPVAPNSGGGLKDPAAWPRTSHVRD